MSDQIERKKQLLEKKEERIRIEKRLLKEKEQQRRAKKLIEIGQIAGQAGIDSLDRYLLLGAFLEISTQMKEEKSQSLWKKRADEFKEGNKNAYAMHQSLSISFQADPNKEVKVKLRAAGFRWNRFRNEFVGYGDPSAIEQLLTGESFKLEVLSCLSVK